MEPARIDPADTAGPPSRILIVIKLLHTVIWAILGGCVVAIPVTAALGQVRAAGILAVIVAAEIAILAVTGGRCPLTLIAARYTQDRSDNFDIYLPLWLARYNKLIFGTLYLLGLAVLVLNWSQLSRAQ